MPLWPGTPPGPERHVGPKKFLRGPNDGLVAGRAVQRLTNVETPEIEVVLPPKEKRNGTVVVICPGGGFKLLAWDLEGTEPAAWLTSLGITAVILQYRTPTAELVPDWQLPVQDAQRAISLVRSRAKKWGVDIRRVGLMGFSAGAITSTRALVAGEKRSYPPVDRVDELPCRPDFAVVVYPAHLTDAPRVTLRPDVAITKAWPPVLLVQTADDPVGCENSVLLFQALKQAGVPAELHIYGSGGHGYGVRTIAGASISSWPDRCRDWLSGHGWLR